MGRFEIVLAGAWFSWACGSEPIVRRTSGEAEQQTGSVSAALVTGTSCDAYQAQQFGDVVFGIEAEQRTVLAGNPSTISLGSAFGGKVVKFGVDHEIALPVSFREVGQYAFYLRGRGLNTGSDSVFASAAYNGVASQQIDFGEAGALEWRQVAVFSIGAADLHQAGTVRVRESEPNFELDAIAFVKVGSGAAPENAFVHAQQVGNSVLPFPAERLDHVADPDADGIVFSVTDGGFAQGWQVLKAPAAADGLATETLAIYRVKFASAGTYQLHLKTRGFTYSNDSFFVPTGFGVNPSLELHTGVHESFDWQTLSNLNSFVVSSANVGKVLELRIGARDALSELDSLAFVRVGSVPTAQKLDAELGHFEAENATSTGIVPVSHSGASGGVRATGFWQVGDRIDFGWVPVPTNGRLYVRYSLDRETGKQASVYRDGQDVATLQFMPTGSWAAYATTFAYLPGSGNIELRIDPDDYRANLEESSASIDRISLGEDGRQCVVSDLSTLQSKLSSARPGDTFVIPNGAHDQTLELTQSGTPDRPIVLRAQTAGEVDLGPGTGSGHRMRIRGDYNVIDGITYANHITTAHTAIFVYDTATGTTADHNRITNVSIVDFNRPVVGGEQVDWVAVGGGQYNRIDHCHFSNRRSQGVGVKLVGEDASIESSSADYNVVDHNYFGPGPNSETLCPQAANCVNGWEAVVLRREPRFTASRSFVKYNLFDGSDGDGEVISDKGNGNYHFYNTFQNLDNGHLTLRHAREARVEGNTFVDCAIGVRAFGEDHVIVNNHFQNVDTGVRIPGGQHSLDPAADPENACYFPANKLIVAHNTFTQGGTAIQSSNGNDCEYNYDPEDPTATLGNTAATHVILANNFAADGVTPLVQTLSLISPLLMSNVSTLASPPAGWTSKQVPVSADGLGLLRASAGSGIDGAGAPGTAIRAAAGTGYALYPDLLLDFDAQERSTTTPDAGADELGVVPGYARRLAASDVGPRWGTRLQNE